MFYYYIILYMDNIPLYDLPDEQLSDFGFKIYQLKNSRYTSGNLQSIPLDTHMPHRHNFYEIFIFDQGGGVHEVDFCTYPVKPRSVHFIAPGQVHLLGKTAQSNGYVLAFTGDFLSEGTLKPGWLLDLPFFNLLRSSQIIQLNPADFEYYIQILRHIAVDYHSMGNKARDIIQSYVKILLLKSSFLCRDDKEMESQTEDNAHSIVRRFRRMLEQHFDHNHQVKHYSHLLNISSAHLNKCCKQVLGKTVSEMIAQRLILEAKRLLIFTEWSSKEIAYKLQFEDPAYFSRIFKKKTGYAPSEFRMVMHEKYKTY